jgi:hypothetical protein
MKRFAAMYMDEDPEAPNYDTNNKVIKSLPTRPFPSRNGWIASN